MLSRRRLETLDYRKKFRVKPGEKLRLSKIDPSFTGEHESEAMAKEATERSRGNLAHEQNLLYAEHERSILFVLQAMDAGGKDGTRRSRMRFAPPAPARRRGT
jgi:polyphosphate kinase 2 (PPK2 family)